MTSPTFHFEIQSWRVPNNPEITKTILKSATLLTRVMNEMEYFGLWTTEAPPEGDNGTDVILCPKDALTDNFGWTVQTILASLAFTCLVSK